MDTLSLLAEFDRLALERIAQLENAGRVSDAKRMTNLYNNVPCSTVSELAYWVKFLSKTAKVA